VITSEERQVVIMRAGRERRENARVEKAVECQCEWVDQLINARTVDISIGGVSVSHPFVVPPEGTEIFVTLYGDDPVTVRGVVVHVEPLPSQSPIGGHFGVQFVGSDEEKTRKVISVISTPAALRDDMEGWEEYEDWE
jgi:hypothetical protein